MIRDLVVKQVVPMVVKPDMKREGEPRLLQATASFNSFRKKQPVKIKV